MGAAERADRRSIIPPLAAVIAVGTLFRVIAIGREALWLDEALTLVTVPFPLPDLFFRPVDPTPGLYYALHKLFLPHDAGPVTARLIALIAGILTIPAGYWLGRAALDRKAGVGVAALIAVSAWLVDYSQEARAYSLLVLLSTLSAAALIDAFPSTDQKAVRWRLLSLSVALGIAGIYTHFVGWLWAGPALLIAAFEVHRRRGIRASEAMAAVAILALAVLPELLRLLGYALSPYNGYNWIRQPDLQQIAKVIGDVASPHFLAFWMLENIRAPWNVIALLLLTVGAVAWLTAALVVLMKKASDVARGRQVAIQVIAVLLALPLLAWVISVTLSPIWIERTLLPMLPACFVVLAGLARLKGQSVALGMIIAIYAADCAATGFVRKKSGWPDALAAIEHAGFSSLPVVSCPYWRAPPLLHALQQYGGNAPVVVHSPYGPALLSTGRDDGSAWIGRYIDLISKPNLPAYAQEPRRPTDSSETSARAWIFIRTDCSEQELAALRSWLGEGHLEKLAQVDGGTESRNIQIDVFQSVNPHIRPVVTGVRH